MRPWPSRGWSMRAGRARDWRRVSSGRRPQRWGAPLEVVAVGLPRIDDETLRPIVDLLDEARIPARAPREEAPSSAGAVAFALGVLSMASRGLSRVDVVAVLRSRYVNARRLANV